MQLELTDGWYWLRASGDERLTQLARWNRIGQGGLWLLLQMRVINVRRLTSRLPRRFNVDESSSYSRPTRKLSRAESTARYPR